MQWGAVPRTRCSITSSAPCLRARTRRADSRFAMRRLMRRRSCASAKTAQHCPAPAWPLDRQAVVCRAMRQVEHVAPLLTNNMALPSLGLHLLNPPNSRPHNPSPRPGARRRACCHTSNANRCPTCGVRLGESGCRWSAIGRPTLRFSGAACRQTNAVSRAHQDTLCAHQHCSNKTVRRHAK